MGTYSLKFAVDGWGSDSDPVAFRVEDAAGVVRTPTLTTPITGQPAGGGRFIVVATIDEAWGVCDGMFIDTGGQAWNATSQGPVDVRFVRGGAAALDTGTGAGGTGTGTGDFAVDHDGGAGVTVDGAASAPDCMRFTRGGSGVDDVEVIAYLKADYDAGARGAADRKGTTYSGSDGRWEAPLMLDPGTYTIVASARGFLARAFTVVVP